jgi:hypothetical protein
MFIYAWFGYRYSERGKGEVIIIYALKGTTKYTSMFIPIV